VAKYCQKLFSGQPKELNKQILITTWQSLKNIAASPVNGQKVLSEYTAVFADEAHSSSAKEVQAILEKCRNAAYRVGTTGTLNNEKVHQLLIEGFLGPIYKVITTKDLIDNGQVSDLDIKCFSLKYPEQFCKDFSIINDKGKKAKISYPDEIAFLIKNKKRNDFICKMAIASQGTTLILVNHVNDHAKPLYDRLKEMSDKPVYYVSGEVSADRREEIRKVANMEDCIIVGTYGTLQQGVNIPNIRNVIFGCPSKSPIRVLQSIGRGLRLHKDKDKMILIDIIDDIRYKNKENFSYVHGLERISIYRKEKFNINIKEINFII
jgi:superfamily II DNA or RNA helicase